MRQIRMIGVISDTHGLLRPEVLPLFSGAQLIIHAGDIGSADILDKLGSIAPVLAVRGNNDQGDWARDIPHSLSTKVGEVSIHVVHDVKDLGPGSSRRQVVVAGHSHRPSVDRRDGILYLNPGSAGPRRFRLPVSVARLMVRGKSVDAEIVTLQV